MASAYKLIEQHVATGNMPGNWMPQFDQVGTSHGLIVASIKEYGCGVYGCVIPTLDPNVVVKLTTDSTEAEFAAMLAGRLVAPICVTYHKILHTTLQHRGATVYVMWRDNAEDVGRVDEVLGAGAGDLVSTQHQAAQQAYLALLTGTKTERALAKWEEACAAMAAQDKYPEIAELGAGMLRVWGSQGILFGDVHVGNMGRVGDRWVITDPGHVAVVTDDGSLIPADMYEDRESTPPPSRRTNPARNPAPSSDAGGFAATVYDAGRKVAVGRGREQALLRDVWQQLRRDGSRASYDEFKCWLLERVRAFDIELIASNVPGAGDSAIEIDGETYHAISLPVERKVVGAASEQSPDDVLKQHGLRSGYTTGDDGSVVVTLQTDGGDHVGELVVKRHPDGTYRSHYVHMERWLRGQGIGNAMYRLADAILMRLHGQHLMSDYQRSADAERTWEGLARAGYATPIPDPDHPNKPAHWVMRSQEAAPDTFVDAVLTVASTVAPPGRRGDKVFIAAIWQRGLQIKSASIADLSLADFKHKLARVARQDHRIQLLRSDIQARSTQERQLMAESEISDRFGTLHFVRDTAR